MFQDDDLGEKIWRSSSLTITLTTTMSLKREENTDEKVARPSVKRIPHGADTSDPIADSAECPDQKIVVGNLEDIGGS